jgi:hypothetical protein
MMSRGYVHACLYDQAGQIGESGALRREEWVAGRGYSEISRWQPQLVSIKDCIILAPVGKV